MNTQNEWVEVTGGDQHPNWDFDVNPICQGYYMSRKDDVGPNNGSLIHVLNFQTMSVFTVWMNKVLAGKIGEAPAKCLVHIVFKGLRETKTGGRSYKDFEVKYRRVHQEEIEAVKSYEYSQMNSTGAQQQSVAQGHPQQAAPQQAAPVAPAQSVQQVAPQPQQVAPQPQQAAPMPQQQPAPAPQQAALVPQQQAAPAPTPQQQAASASQPQQAAPVPQQAAPAPQGTVSVPTGTMPQGTIPAPQGDQPYTEEDLPF